MRRTSRLWWRTCVTATLLCSGESLGRGFDKNIAKKKRSRSGDNIRQKHIEPVSIVEPALTDKWGLPLDFDDFQAEDHPVSTIRARTIALPMTHGTTSPLLSTVDIPTNTCLSMTARNEEWLPRLRALHVDPLVIRVEGLLTGTECDRLIKLTSSSRSREMPREAGTFGSQQAARRTSTTWYVRFREPEVAPLLSRAAHLLGVDDLRCFEEVQLARYRSGERFRMHEDAVPPSLLCDDKLRDGGQRLATLLVYLSGDGNTHTHGGATSFRDLGETPPLRVAPVKGDALLFFPAVRHLHSSVWTPDDRTAHQAMPVLKGEKWVSQIWLHEAPYPPVILDENDRTQELKRAIHPFCSPPPLKDRRTA